MRYLSTALLFVASVSFAADDQRSLFERTYDPQFDTTAQIQQHLFSVVDQLETRGVSNLNDQQRANRRQHIEVLARYAEAGVFPQNDVCSDMTPIFIDSAGRACAVGHLMIESGAAELADTISFAENLAYVGEIRTAGAADWIQSSGLSAEECAMIQPAYPCQCVFGDLRAETNGTDVVLSWDLLEPINYVVIWRDGEEIGALQDVD
ncbi:MAG: hypothetical protein AAF517_23645, partial [Planctomycetota bacterium]